MKPGYGTEANPLTFADAMKDIRIMPGHTIWLRGGTYLGDFISVLNGTDKAPITIKPYPSEHPVIDGGLTINGSYTHWYGIEHRYSGWTTRIGDPGKYLYVNGPGCRIINCYIHDLAIVGFWEPAVGAEFYGNVIHNIGCMVGGKGYGHSLYTQNSIGRKLIKHNVMGSPFNWNIHAYTEGGSIDNFDIVENTCFNAGILSGTLRDGILIGGGVDSMGSVMDGNLTYGNRRGYLKYGTKGVELKASDNYFADDWSPADTVLTASTNNTTKTIGNRVFVHPNAYKATRANVTIYNEAGADTVSVDLSAVMGLKEGDTVNCHNCQDYFADIQSLVLDGNKKIAVNMQVVNRTVAAPYQWEAPATTFPTFGAFVVEKA